MNSAMLRLFNGVYVEVRGVAAPFEHTLLTRMISNGYILSPEITPSSRIMKEIESIVGISGEKANATFHKSWAVVRDSDIETLVLQQIVHYITTYGFEALGIYSNDTVYIPHEELNLPEVTLDIPLVVIKAMDRDDVLDGIFQLAGSGIALSKETIADLMEIIKTLGYDYKILTGIKNRELKSLLYHVYKLAPEEPVEYLRYLISELTGETLVIKNKHLISLIKTEADREVLDSLLKVAPVNLASIFLRYKPLFLALKSVSNNKAFFNRLRKDAERMHEALPVDYMSSVTEQIKHGILSESILKRKLSDASIFRKIRLAYALNFRLNAGDSIVYRVRNGRGWVDDFDWRGNEGVTERALQLVLESIAKEMEERVAGKTFYIPVNMHYSLPATEKQFIGNLPVNSYVAIDGNMLVGIHWEDTSTKTEDSWLWGLGGRVDLDFSLSSIAGKLGWDASYRSDDRNILFSGDVTSAPLPNGASEFWYIANNRSILEMIAFVNDFTHREDSPVSCKLIVAEDTVASLYKDYMVDVGKIKVSVNMKFTEKQNVVGLISHAGGQNRFYFSNVAIGNTISMRNQTMADKAREYFLDSCKNPIELAYVLEMAGANIVSERPDDEEYVDLSPEALDKTTIIKLLV